MARKPRPHLILIAALLALAAAFPATAGAATSGCDEAAASRPFARWLDVMSYVPVPGGTFEAGQAAWTLRGGAAVVADNEPWAVSGAGSRALRLPAGASATSPEFCAGLAYPTIRFFARGRGLLQAALVEVLYRDAAGVLRAAPLPNLGLGSSWAPTLPLPTLSGLPLLTGSKLALRVTALLGETSIDDVYVDPFSRH